jgi:hypothetical protein
MAQRPFIYIFPVVILGTIACNVGLAVLEPSMIGEPAINHRLKQVKSKGII